MRSRRQVRVSCLLHSLFRVALSRALRPVPVLMSLKECLTKAQADPAVKAIVVTGAQGKFSAGFDITHLAKLQATGSQEDFGTDVNAFLIRLLEAGAKPSVAGAHPRPGRLERKKPLGRLWTLTHTPTRALTSLSSYRQRRPRRRSGGGDGVQRTHRNQGRAAGPAGTAARCVTAWLVTSKQGVVCLCRVRLTRVPSLRLPVRPRAGIIPGFGGTARLPRLVGLEKGLTMMLRSKNIKARYLLCVAAV